MKKKGRIFLPVILSLMLVMSYSVPLAVFADTADGATIATDTSTVTPEGGGSTVTPEGGGSTETPEGGESTETPEGGGSTETPEGGESTETPEGGGSTVTPEGGESTVTPEGGASTEMPEAAVAGTTSASAMNLMEKIAEEVPGTATLEGLSSSGWVLYYRDYEKREDVKITDLSAPSIDIPVGLNDSRIRLNIYNKYFTLIGTDIEVSIDGSKATYSLTTAGSYDVLEIMAPQGSQSFNNKTVQIKLAPKIKEDAFDRYYFQLYSTAYTQTGKVIDDKTFPEETKAIQTAFQAEPGQYMLTNEDGSVQLRGTIGSPSMSSYGTRTYASWEIIKNTSAAGEAKLTKSPKDTDAIWLPMGEYTLTQDVPGGSMVAYSTMSHTYFVNGSSTTPSGGRPASIKFTISEKTLTDMFLANQSMVECSFSSQIAPPPANNFNITIKKAVEGLNLYEPEEGFKFQIYRSDKTVGEPFYLKAGESIQLTPGSISLTCNTTYTIKEIDIPAEYLNNGLYPVNGKFDFFIPNNEKRTEVTCTVTNRMKSGAGLGVLKVIPQAGPAPEEFQFQLTGSLPGAKKFTAVGTVAADAKYNPNNGNSTQVTWDKNVMQLPYGEYTLVETNFGTNFKFDKMELLEGEAQFSDDGKSMFFTVNEKSKRVIVGVYNAKKDAETPGETIPPDQPEEPENPGREPGDRPTRPNPEIVIPENNVPAGEVPDVVIPDEEPPASPAVILEEEEIPAGAVLPKTGGISPELFAVLGIALTALGVALRRKENQ